MMQAAENWSRSDNFVVRKTVSVSSPTYRSRAGFPHARTQAAARTASIVVPLHNRGRAERTRRD